METNSLQELICTLKNNQEELKEEVLRSVRTKKDKWDKLQAVAPIVSGVLISSMAGYFTFSYNQQQLHIQEIQTIEKFIPHMLGSEKSKKAAILAMSELTNTALAARFASLFASEGTVSALKSIAKSSSNKDITIVKEALGTALENVAERYGQENRYAEAEDAYKSAIEIYETQNDAANPDLARKLEKLADLYKAQGKFAQAEPLLRRSLKIKEQLYGPNATTLASTLRDLSELYKGQGKQIEADNTYQKALAIDAKAIKLLSPPNVPSAQDTALESTPNSTAEPASQIAPEDSDSQAHVSETWHRHTPAETKSESGFSSTNATSILDDAHM